MKKIERTKVNEIIRKYVEEGKFDDFYWDDFEYWQCIPYVTIAGKSIALAKTYYYFGSLGIFTIYDYKTIKSIKQMLDTIVANRDIIKKNTITNYAQLKEAIDYYLY